MIVHKAWVQTGKRSRNFQWTREGWFLFGLIPIYVRDLEPRCERRA